MSKLSYDLALLAGTILIGAGVGLQFGAAPALMAVGGLVITLTLIGVVLMRGKN